MTNKHIELVKKWIDDNDGVNLKKLKEDSDAAWMAAAAAASTADDADEIANVSADAAAKAADAAVNATKATNAAYNAALAAARAAADTAAHVRDAKRWVQGYEEATEDEKASVPDTLEARTALLEATRIQLIEHELKPCPFCSAGAHVTQKNGLYRVECKQRPDYCSMNMRTHHCVDITHAAAAWNTRTHRVGETFDKFFKAT